MVAVILLRTNEAYGTVANAVLRSVKEREDIHSAKIPAKIVASWNVEGGIAGGQTRGVRKVGFKVCCVSRAILLLNWHHTFDSRNSTFLYRSMTSSPT